MMAKRSKEQVRSAMAKSAAPWHEVMKAITGIEETPGDANNPKIMGMRDFISKKWEGDPLMPGIASYMSGYTGDDVAWCGLTQGFCVSVCNIRPPYDQSDDTGSLLWAKAWAADPGYQHLATPRVGCITVLTREGGGHIATYEGESGSSVTLRGGNQSNSVCVSNYAKADVIAYLWPRAAGPIPPAERRTLEQGDEGGDVAHVQIILGIPVDGEYGPTTKGAVQGFQAGAGLDDDGVVGPATWEALDDLEERKRDGDDGLLPEDKDAIEQLALASELLTYDWPGRGQAPRGYVIGMALSFALAVQSHEDEDSTAELMASENSGDPDKDVFAWYKTELGKMGWDTSEAGLDNLRYLFALLISLGPRESSGRYCEGRDQSASNTSSDEAEAGLFQQSWNSRSCSNELQRLFDLYNENPNGFLEHFREGVTPNGTDLGNFGSPDGATFQFLAKYAPAFAVFCCGVGLRKLRQHWGPINRKEIDLDGAEVAESLLLQVQDYMTDERPDPIPPEPEPEPEPDEVPTLTIRLSADHPVQVRIVPEDNIEET